MAHTNRYRVLTAKPLSLPSDIAWEYMEIPRELAYLRPDLPVSNHKNGVIVTNRPLTAREQRRFMFRLQVEAA
jgi:hypothetical protein